MENEKIYKKPNKKAIWAWKIVCKYKGRLLTNSIGGVWLRRCEWMNAYDCGKNSWMGDDEGSWIVFATKDGAQRYKVAGEQEDEKVVKVKVKDIISEGIFFGEKSFTAMSIYFPCNT